LQQDKINFEQFAASIQILQASLFKLFTRWTSQHFIISHQPRWFNPISDPMGCDTEPIGIFPNPMIRQKSDRNPGDDPTDGSVVLDPIGSYTRIRYFYRSIVF
jgi:hypothetical protein